MTFYDCLPDDFETREILRFGVYSVFEEMEVAVRLGKYMGRYHRRWFLGLINNGEGVGIGM